MIRISQMDKTITNPVRFEILQWLVAYKQLERNDLLKKMKINSGTLTRHLERLERNGYIKRGTNSPEKEKITDKGIEAWKELHEAVNVNLKEMMEKGF